MLLKGIPGRIGGASSGCRLYFALQVYIYCFLSLLLGSKTVGRQLELLPTTNRCVLCRSQHHLMFLACFFTLLASEVPPAKLEIVVPYSLPNDLPSLQTSKSIPYAGSMFSASPLLPRLVSSLAGKFRSLWRIRLLQRISQSAIDVRSQPGIYFVVCVI